MLNLKDHMAKSTVTDIKKMILEKKRDLNLINRRNRMNEILNKKRMLSSNTISNDDAYGNQMDIDNSQYDQANEIVIDNDNDNDITINTENFDSLDLDNELDNLNDKYISVCPICYQPAVSCKEFVSCVNLCFEFKIKQTLFNDEYTLDNLMDDFMQMRSTHGNCKSKISVMLFQDKISLFCDKCFKDSLIGNDMVDF